MKHQSQDHLRFWLLWAWPDQVEHRHGQKVSDHLDLPKLNEDTHGDHLRNGEILFLWETVLKRRVEEELKQTKGRK